MNLEDQSYTVNVIYVSLSEHQSFNFCTILWSYVCFLVPLIIIVPVALFKQFKQMYPKKKKFKTNTCRIPRFKLELLAHGVDV